MRVSRDGGRGNCVSNLTNRSSSRSSGRAQGDVRRQRGLDGHRTRTGRCRRNKNINQYFATNKYDVNHFHRDARALSYTSKYRCTHYPFLPRTLGTSFARDGTLDGHEGTSISPGAIYPPIAPLSGGWFSTLLHFFFCQNRNPHALWGDNKICSHLDEWHAVRPPTNTPSASQHYLRGKIITAVPSPRYKHYYYGIRARICGLKYACTAVVLFFPFWDLRLERESITT